ncbi:MAG: bifunctional heptose 7-phosphate kinase/heptose 1-phosphate adenyltransferase [Herpetosiphonaceae bacterium]|nr:bifunctional heptose 7-phosphate kinase/heptose 1-phosphate adenyltransferase [Herpetosiphonaceae bacterium]
MAAFDVVELVGRFRQQQVLVVGDVILDCYYSGRAERISPEGPVPVVQSGRKHQYPGGAANAAANLAALGGKVRCLSVVGPDHAGRILQYELAARGIEAQLVVEQGRTTLTKLRIIADQQYVVRWDEGDRQALTPTVEAELLDRLADGFRECDAVIVADYCYGALNDRIITTISRLKQQYNRLVVVDSKNLPVYRGMAASVITPNHVEAQRALGWTVRDIDSLGRDELEALGQQLLEHVGSTWALVTLGARGSLLFEAGQPTYRVAARPVANPHVSGAGDTFTATLTLALASGAPVQVAVEVAAEAAAVVVGKADTATVSSHELLQRLARSGLMPEIAVQLAPTLARYRDAGKRIVFTNGVFDGLNSGHMAFLRAARQLGDLLIVGVNSDRGVLARRGTASTFPERERVAALAALDYVEHVVLFDELTPETIIQSVRPHIHVKGGDYRLDDLPEANAVRDVGGEIIILPLLEGQNQPYILSKWLQA